MDALLDEYYRLFYGDAAPLMKKYWELVEKITMKGNITHPLDHYTIDEAKAPPPADADRISDSRAMAPSS